MLHKKGQLIKKVKEPFLYKWLSGMKKKPLIKKLTEPFLYKW